MIILIPNNLLYDVLLKNNCTAKNSNCIEILPYFYFF